MKAIIVEDEPLAVERLQLLLQQYDPHIQVVAAMDSISEAIRWLSPDHQAIDLILMDIQLADGSAFEIFRQVKITVPVIFTTAYDQYALAAFSEFSIGYLLKPISLPALSQAMEKMKAMRIGPASPGNYWELIRRMDKGAARYKSRFLGKIGSKLFFVDKRSVAFFCADNKIVFLVTPDNTRYVIEYTLEELETQLDPADFFRVNRSMIIHSAAIGQVKPFLNSRLRIMLKDAVSREEILISRDRVAAFKKWADS